MCRPSSSRGRKRRWSPYPSIIYGAAFAIVRKLPSRCLTSTVFRVAVPPCQLPRAVCLVSSPSCRCLYAAQAVAATATIISEFIMCLACARRCHAAASAPCRYPRAACRVASPPLLRHNCWIQNVPVNFIQMAILIPAMC